MNTDTNAMLRERELRHTSGVYGTKPIAIVRGKGARVWDADGMEYIDCSAGHGVACLGHAHPRLVHAVSNQMGRISSLASSFPNDQRAEFQERLVDFLPAGFERLFLCNSGTEAVEAALKFARISTGRTGIVAAQRGFHGRTMGSLSCTWEKKYRKPFEPLLPDVQHAPFGRLAAFGERMNEDTACVIVEVVQGEGGVRPATTEFLRGLRQICDEKGVLLIFDEVQTGFGRTGMGLALEHSGVAPDLIALGKAIGGGIPMGAVGIGAKVEELAPGIHGSTFGGNPLACAAGLASLKVLEEEGLVERSRTLGARFKARLEQIDSPEIREVRGLGLMVAVDLRVRVAPILAALQSRGVIALPAGPTVLRFLPPLVIEESDLDRVAIEVEGVIAQLVHQEPAR
ncbi:MAG: acetylornithine/LysW-gamma-L-lysine aminotransferase [Candidatus Paceibacteria bacterium]|jgi:acetylornithine/LysW-gamma-L-lysine aminotransferase